jgi:hypothetical protein
MAKIWDNGKIRDMTAEELAEAKEFVFDIVDTAEERLEKLENIIEKISKLLGVK